MSSDNITLEEGVNTSIPDFLTDPIKVLQLIDDLTEENLHINPVYIKLAGSITGGYFLTQLIFLSRAFHHQEFFKTDQHFKDKLGFTEWELREHRKKLKAQKLVNIRKGQGGKLLYTVNRINILKAVHALGYFNTEESSSSIPRNPRLQYRGILGTLLSNNNYNNDLDNKPPNPQGKAEDNCYVLEGELETDFDKFWQIYPEQVKKKEAQKAFKKVKEPVQNLITALEMQLQEKLAKEQLGLFCPSWPHPSTWLNGERWKDKIKSPSELMVEAKREKKPVSGFAKVQIDANALGANLTYEAFGSMELLEVKS